MDAKEFLSEYQRMCKSFEANCTKGLKVCPAYTNKCCVYKGRVLGDVIVDIVEKWSKDNGNLTNFEKFCDTFPSVPAYLDAQKSLIIDTYNLEYKFWEKPYYNHDGDK